MVDKENKVFCLGKSLKQQKSNKKIFKVQRCPYSVYVDTTKNAYVWIVYNQQTIYNKHSSNLQTAAKEAQEFVLDHLESSDFNWFFRMLKLRAFR